MNTGNIKTQNLLSRHGNSKIGQFQWLGIGGVTVALALVLIRCLLDPTPIVAAGLVLNRMTCSLGVLVALVGAVVAKFSCRYLDGDPKQRSFTNLLVLTVIAALSMMLADNVLVLVIGWAVTSFGLHFLLTHYNKEHDAITVARKKFLISRLGDFSLILACWFTYRDWGTLSLTNLFSRVQESNLPPTVVVWLICFAAISKSAQFPFHSWLPDTLASPTPVSALMHAGIINGGGVLLLKFAPALVEVPSAGLFLATVGSITMTIGMISMWGQSSVKRKLAWSTVSQMGFMTAEIGILAFIPAFIHIFSHGLYKATAFLDSGTIDHPFPKPSAITGWPSLALLCFGWAISIPLQLLIHAGPILARDWSVIAMTGFGAGQLLIAAFSNLKQVNANVAVTWLLMIVTAQVVALLSAFLLRLSSKFLELPAANPSAIATVTCSIPVATLLLLSVYRAFEPSIRASTFGQKLFVHAQNGFYIGLRADLLVAKIWKPLTTKAI